MRKHLGAHDVFAVDYMGWAGLKKDELLAVAEAEGFEAFLAGDKNLSYQQNLAGRRMAILALSAIDFDILKANLPRMVAAIDRVKPDTFVMVGCGG